MALSYFFPGGKDKQKDYFYDTKTNEWKRITSAFSQYKSYYYLYHISLFFVYKYSDLDIPDNPVNERELLLSKAKQIFSESNKKIREIILNPEDKILTYDWERSNYYNWLNTLLPLLRNYMAEQYRSDLNDTDEIIMFASRACLSRDLTPLQITVIRNEVGELYKYVPKELTAVKASFEEFIDYVNIPCRAVSALSDKKSDNGVFFTDVYGAPIDILSGLELYCDNLYNYYWKRQLTPTKEREIIRNYLDARKELIETVPETLEIVNRNSASLWDYL